MIKIQSSSELLHSVSKNEATYFFDKLCETLVNFSNFWQATSERNFT